MVCQSWRFFLDDDVDDLGLDLYMSFALYSLFRHILNAILAKLIYDFRVNCVFSYSAGIIAIFCNYGFLFC